MTRSSSHDCNEWIATTQEEIMEGDQVTQSTNDILVKQILLNLQSLPNRAKTSNSKVAIIFLKNMKIIGGVEHVKVPEKPFASEVK